MRELDQVLRTSPGQSGFMLKRYTAHSSEELRAEMLRIASLLSCHSQILTGYALVPAVGLRLDQRVPTPPHFDGGPEDSVLLLGYEESSRDSSVGVCEPGGVDRIRGAGRLSPLFRTSPTASWVLAVNNSAPQAAGRRTSWLGLQHGAAEISREGGSRFVNSLLLGLAPQVSEPVDTAQWLRAPPTAVNKHRHDGP